MDKTKASPQQIAQAKQALLQRVKGLKMKSEKPIIPNPQQIKNTFNPTPQQISIQSINKNRSLFHSGAPKNYLYPELHRNILQPPEQKQDSPFNKNVDDKNDGIKIIGDDDDQNEEKGDGKNDRWRDGRREERQKKPYYEHYSKQGVYQCVLEHVRNHPNPSGRPPQIPKQYEGVEVVPKRPWVYFGPQNIPPTDCEQINERNILKIFQEVKKTKNSSGILKRSNLKKKKTGRRNNDDMSEMSEDFTSNFNITDSADLSKESDLISQFKSQSKKMKQEDSSMKNQQDDEQYSSISMSGSMTQKQRYNLFDNSESQEQQSIDSDKKYMTNSKIKDSSFPYEKHSIFEESFSGKTPKIQESQIQSEKQQKNKKSKSSKNKKQKLVEQPSESLSAPKRRPKPKKRVIQSDEQSENFKPKKRAPPKRKAKKAKQAMQKSEKSSQRQLKQEQQNDDLSFILGDIQPDISLSKPIESQIESQSVPANKKLQKSKKKKKGK